MSKTLTFVILLAAATVWGEARWATPEDEAAVLGELQALFQGAEIRRPGSPGNLAMEEKVAQRFAAAGGEHGEIKFRAPAFLPGQTTLTLADRPPIELLPLHPTLFRPGNFKERDFKAQLVYLGRGLPEDLDRVKGADLEGALALMDFDCGANWLNFLRFGIKGFIFIGSENYERFDALSKVYSSEVATPRFLVGLKDGRELQAAAAGAPTVRVQAEPSRWENRYLRDLWVLIPGADPDLAAEVCVILAPLDSNCVAPDLAAGAQAGANLGLLLRLLDEFQREPPARSVLLAAVNAHTQNFRGERMLAWHLLAPDVEKVRDALNADRRMEKLLVDQYSQLHLDQFNAKDEELLIQWRTLVDDSTGKNITIKNPVVALAKRDVNRLKTDKLHLLQQNPPPPDLAARLKALDAECVKYVKVLTLFNKFGIQSKLSDLSGDEREILRGYVRKVIELNQTCAELNEKDIALDKQNDAIRDVFKGRRVPFAISLELDWSSPQMGFCLMNLDGRQRWGIRWGANVHRIASELPAVVNDGAPNLLTDTLTMRGGMMERHYFAMGDTPVVNKSGILYFHIAAKTPAFSLKNVNTDLSRAFLPNDTLDGLPRGNLAQGMRFVPALLRAVLNDRNLTTSSELDKAENLFKPHDIWSIQVKIYKFDELAASVYPDIPVAGSALIVRPYNPFGVFNPLQSDAIAAGDVINADLALTDERAATVLYGLRESVRGAPGITAAFHYDPDFITVDHVIDAGEVHKKIDSSKLYADLTLALFECQEFPIYTTADSSMVSATPIVISDMIPLTAKGNSTPRKFGLTGVASAMTKKTVSMTAGAPAAFYFARDERIKLMTADKRLAINATAKDYEGQGYATAQELGNDFFANVARDMSVLNHARIKRLKDVAGELTQEFLDRGDKCRDRMDAARAQRDHLGYLRALYESLGAQVKSYEQAKQTCDDMLKAVVVYMALLLPFCLFLEKLLFKFVRIEHEMAAFAALFVITFIVFRLIHPAFRVAQAAEAIFVAFVMGALGLFVIAILRGRFEGEMQVLFRSYLGGTDDDVGYSTVTQKAMMIGVNNMKRRRIRTMLTTATIVLVAFTMLSFTSITKRVNPTVISKSKDAPYTGFMFHWPGKSTMDESTLRVFQNLFEKRGQTIVRRWAVADDNAPFSAASGAGQSARIECLLGLPVAENGFLAPMPLIAGRYFTNDAASEVLISTAAAEVLGIDPDQLESATLTLLGRTLKVAGVFDDAQFRYLKDLNGNPIIPIKRIAKGTTMDESVWGSAPTANQAEELDAPGVLFFVDTASLLILPVELAARMGAKPYSVSVKLRDDESVAAIMDLVLTATRTKFFVSSRAPFSPTGKSEENIAGGVYYVGSNYTTSVGGLAVLLIPLIIASTIILNTMLGSVYERKKEIAIYNAIGLNPHHIGTFFLAESFVYGVIGAVGGYLIGQVLSLVLSRTGGMQGINLNYSSLSVAYVILFTIAIVLLSTLYPAMVATKAAVPSGKRKWSLPEHDGHQMRVLFPFIYHTNVAAGIMAYLHEYFGRFTEASIGDLIANLEGRARGRDGQGREKFVLEYSVALAPYDLGVTQRLLFSLEYNDLVQTYRLELRLIRVSGQDSNWVTTNRPFLERLRKYLMRWRNLDLAQQELYCRQAMELFGGAS